ncbi:hypothetical protein [Hominifimenecus sp. rT4P-3]|uniref:hypothetical protein n=1 Tax=Hominifimenecus sp. rT4P-3 TaxID=3242979 RepID=UPI003DA4C084
MFQIENNNLIRVIQGDTGAIEIHLDNYELKTGDQVFFTVKKNLSDPDSVLQKIITTFENGDGKILLSSTDTNLPCGEYVYDLQCNLADGRVDTVVGPSYFRVEGGVTDD